MPPAVGPPLRAAEPVPPQAFTGRGESRLLRTASRSGRKSRASVSPFWCELEASAATARLAAALLLRVSIARAFQRLPEDAESPSNRQGRGGYEGWSGGTVACRLRRSSGAINSVCVRSDRPSQAWKRRAPQVVTLQSGSVYWPHRWQCPAFPRPSPGSRETAVAKYGRSLPPCRENTPMSRYRGDRLRA
jgi:hypothetical protein